jgi:hypothetical protein
VAGNPLVAEAEAPSATAGTGLVGDIANLTADNDPWDYTIDGVATALDVIGMALDPFGAIASAGVGWLLQHVDFLREPIDKLTGDPAAITAVSQTWVNIAKNLNQNATDYATALKSTEHWSGRAADDYRKAAEDLRAVLEATANHAMHASDGILAAGILVGTERSIIYDMISTFIGRVVVEALVALASSWFTFGASIAAFVAAVDVDAAIQGEEFALRVGALMKKIGKFAQKFDSMGNRAKTLAKDLDRAGGKLRMKAGGSKGRSIIQRNRFLARPHNPVVSKALDASQWIKHSPLNNVSDITDNPAVKQGIEGVKSGDDAHKSREG